jgi:WD40 repeat protein
MVDLTPVAAEAGAAEGDPRPVYTWEGPPASTSSLVRSYAPSNGGAPRLVAGVGFGHSLGVWDTGTGAFLSALQGPGPDYSVRCVTYQRSSDGRPRVVAATHPSQLYIWDGDDFRLLHTMRVHPQGRPVRCLAVYEEPTSGSTRLVTG